MTIFEKYKKPFTEEEVQQALAKILANSDKLYTVQNLKTLFSFIDLTTLGSEDTTEKVKNMCDKVNRFHGFTRFVGTPNVAAICVYPSLVSTVKEHIALKNFNIASVAGAFPSSQSFIEVKTLEARMAVEQGATEIDMVISVGKFLEGDYQTVFDEIKAMKEAIGDVHLKVILESGVLNDPDKVKIASILAMEAGGDFIKTSTGKMQPAATLEAIYVMAHAAAEFFAQTGKYVGIKPAGGISTGKQAIPYFAVMSEVLGKDWLNSKLFRIGASSLANNLLSEINALRGKTDEVKYF